MDYKIRELKQNEINVLNTFLYEAIFISDGVDAPPYEIINQLELQVYVAEFGKKKGDICYVSECDNKIVGAVWVRIMNDYGHVDDVTPSFAISLFKEYRNYGIGTELVKKMDLVEELGISTSTLAKMSRGEPVSMQEYVKNSTVILVIWFLIIQHQRSENR